MACEMAFASLEIHNSDGNGFIHWRLCIIMGSRWDGLVNAEEPLRMMGKWLLLEKVKVSIQTLYTACQDGESGEIHCNTHFVMVDLYLST